MPPVQDVARYEAQLAPCGPRRSSASRPPGTSSTPSAPSAWRRSTPASPSDGPRPPPRSRQARAAAQAEVEQCRPIASPPGPASWRSVAEPGPERRRVAVAEVMSAGVEPMNAVARRGAGRARAEAPPIDDQGYFTSHHLALARAGRADLRHAGLGHHLLLLVWKAGPMDQEGVPRPDRADRSTSSTSRRRRRPTPRPRPPASARPSATSRASASALLAEADAQAEALLADGRARLDAEIAELSEGGRRHRRRRRAGSRTSCAPRSPGYAAAAADRVVERSLDDAAQQRLIEDYIARVGASSGAPV